MCLPLALGPSRYNENPLVQCRLDRQPKFQSFFGPGIVAKMNKTERVSLHYRLRREVGELSPTACSTAVQGMDVSLICDGSGAGRGGGEKKDVLPPLMPGLKPRVQK